MTWHNLTLGQFKEIVNCLKSKPSNEEQELAQRFLLASIVYRRDVAYFESLRISDFHKVERSFSFIYSQDQLPAVNPPSVINIKGYRLKFDLNPANLKAHDIVDLTTLSRLGEGIVEHLDKILLKYATVKPPVWSFWKKVSEAKAIELINEVSVPKANAVGAFFLTWWAKHLPTIQSYLVREMAKNNKTLEKHLQDIGVG